MGEAPVNGVAAQGLTATAIVLLTWSLLSFAVRLWVKLRKIDSWGADDTAISVAFIVAICHVVALCIATKHGYGSDWSSAAQDERSIAEKALYASQIFYVASVGLTRTSVSLFVTRLARDRSTVKLVKLLAGTCVIFTIIHIFVISIRGNSAEPWTTLNGSSLMFVRWLVVELSGLGVEFGIWATAAWLISGLHMPVRKRISVSAILAVRLIITPIVALRLVYLLPSKTPDPLNGTITADIYTEVVLQLAFMLSSVTCAKPFLRPFHSGYFISTAKSKTSSNPKEGSGLFQNSYLMISKAKSGVTSTTSAKDTTSVHDTSSTADKDATSLTTKSGNYFRPDAVSHQAIASVDTEARPPQDGGNMVIARTQAWTITYAESTP